MGLYGRRKTIAGEFLTRTAVPDPSGLTSTRRWKG
jgi:hypothetical protein